MARLVLGEVRVARLQVCHKWCVHVVVVVAGRGGVQIGHGVLGLCISVDVQGAGRRVLEQHARPVRTGVAGLGGTEGKVAG